MKKVKGFILILLFLTMFIWFGSARGETMMEIGPSQVGSKMSAGVMLTLTERIAGKYDFTVGYISEQNFTRKWQGKECAECEWTVKEQLFAGVELVVTAPFDDKLRLSVGPYIFQRADRIGTDTFRMGLSIEYQFTDRLGLRARHFSLAGTGPEITLCRETETWTTVSCDTPGSISRTNDWNTGQDSWLRLVWYF